MTGYDALVASPFSTRTIPLYNEINNKRKISDTCLRYYLILEDGRILYLITKQASREYEGPRRIILPLGQHLRTIA